MGQTRATILTLLGHFLFHELTISVHAQHNVDPTSRQRGHLRNTNEKEDRFTWLRDHDDGSKQHERNLQFADCAAQFELQIQFDDYPYEVSWTLDMEVVEGHFSHGYHCGVFNGYYSNSTATETNCIPLGAYNFTIYDWADDGICCGFGQGSYKVFVDDVLIKEGGEFGSQELTSFEVKAPPTVSPVPTTTPTPAPTIACSSDEVTLGVEIMLDYSPEAISWNITISPETLVLSSDPFPREKRYATVYREYCLPLGIYEFTIYCKYGYGLYNGYYNVTVNGVSAIKGEGFQDSEASTFVTPNTPTQAPSSAPTIQCSSEESLFELALMLDSSPTEVFWNLTNSVNDLLMEGGNYSFDQGMDLVNIQVCLPESIYTFTMYDVAGDGICCYSGRGYYIVLVDGRQVRYGRGDYGTQEVTTFATPLSPTTSPKPSPSPTVSLQPTPLWTAFPTPSSWTSWPTPLWTSWPTPFWTSYPTWPAPTSAPTVECAADEATLELVVKFSYIVNEISWDLTDSVGNALLSGQHYPDYSFQYLNERNEVHKELCLSAGSYVFTIYATSDDDGGFCCSNSGIYKLKLDGVVVKKGGILGSQESTDIVSAPSSNN